MTLRKNIIKLPRSSSGPVKIKMPKEEKAPKINLGKKTELRFPEFRVKLGSTKFKI